MPGRALLVVDVQQGFTRMGNLASEACAARVPAIEALVRDEAAAGTPIIFTKDSHIPDDLEFQMFPPHCIIGTAEQDLVEELRPFERDAAAVIEKARYSAFHDTKLEAILRDLAPDEVHVAGMCTDICVLHTTADLRNRDYPVVVHRGAVATFDAPGHAADDVNAWALGHIEHILGATVA